MENSQPQLSQLQQRGIRLKDAPGYLGIDRNRFNAEVRPHVYEMRMGKQVVIFDRLDLDAWFEEYKNRNGRRPKAEKLEDDKCQNAIKCRGSASKARSGKLKNAVKTPKAAGSVKAREHLAALRQRKS